MKYRVEDGKFFLSATSDGSDVRVELSSANVNLNLVEVTELRDSLTEHIDAINAERNAVGAVVDYRAAGGKWNRRVRTHTGWLHVDNLDEISDSFMWSDNGGITFKVVSKGIDA